MSHSVLSVEDEHHVSKTQDGIKMSNVDLEHEHEKTDVEAVAHEKTDVEAVTPEVESEFSTQNNLILIGAFCCSFITVGFSNAFGAFEAYYLENLHVNASAISWLGSLAIFFLFAGALAVGLLLQKISPRILIIIGSITLLLGIFLTSICTKYWQLMLTQGLLVGLGNSLLFTPCLMCVTLAFQKRRGIALGLTVSGSSLGGVVWPILLDNLLKDKGFGWTFRITGFIMLPFCIIAASVVTLPGNKATPGGGPPPPKPNIKALFQIRSYLVYAFGAWFSYIGLFTGLFFIAAYGVSRGMSQSLAFYLVAITNAASLFGRILPGFLADRYGSLNLYVIFGALSGVITMCLTAATSSAAIVVIAVAYGFTSGAIISLLGACVGGILPRELSSPGIGLCMVWLSVAALIGSPISGAILDRSGYLALTMFSGVCQVLGAAIVGYARICHNPKWPAAV